MKQLKVETLSGEQVGRLFAKEHGLTSGSLLIEIVEFPFGAHQIIFTHEGKDRFVLSTTDLRPVLAAGLGIATWRIDDVVFHFRNKTVTAVEVAWTERPRRWYEKLFRRA